MRAGLIGAGRVAGIHAAALAAIDDVEVVAVADPRLEAARQLATRYGAAAFADYQDLLAAASLDVVAIAIPHDQHGRVAADAVRAGKHVFLDKPLASTLLDARVLAQLVGDTSTVFMVCHNLLFHPTIERASSLLTERGLGRVTTCRAWSTGWLELAPWDFRRDREKTGGGAWADCVSHLLYVLENLVGPIDEIVGLAQRGETRLGGEDAAGGVVRFAAGGTATLEISYSDWRPAGARDWPLGWRAGYELRGTEGDLLVELLPEARLRFRTDSDDLDLRCGIDFELSFAYAVEHFVACVRSGSRPRVTAADALHVLELIERGYRP